MSDSVMNDLRLDDFGKGARMDDFKRYCGKAHLQVMLLGWITERLRERQCTGNPAIDAIEKDFRNYGLKCNQHLKYQFDRGDDLLVFAQSLVVGGVEAVERISCETTKSEIKQFVKEQLKCFDPVLISGSLVPEKGSKEVTTWTLARRLRNSLSHFRYDYEGETGETGEIRFTDVKPGNGKLTADFKMPLISVLDFSYRFGLACAKWAEKPRLYASKAGED